MLEFIFKIHYNKSSSVLCPSLDSDHREIDASLCQQLLVCAVLLDSAILKHHYQVCVLDGGQPVSDHDAGAALSGFVQGFLDHLLIKQNRSLTLKIIEISFKSKGNPNILPSMQKKVTFHFSCHLWIFSFMYWVLHSPSCIQLCSL